MLIKLAILWGRLELRLIAIQIKIKLMSGQFEPQERVIK